MQIMCASGQMSAGFTQTLDMYKQDIARLQYCTQDTCFTCFLSSGILYCENGGLHVFHDKPNSIFIRQNGGTLTFVTSHNLVQCAMRLLTLKQLYTAVMFAMLCQWMDEVVSVHNGQISYAK